MKLTRVHSFESRHRIFGRDGVLQETVMIAFKKTTVEQESVELSWSHGTEMSDCASQRVPYDVVSLGASQRYVITFPQEDDDAYRDRSSWSPLFSPLHDIG